MYKIKRTHACFQVKLFAQFKLRRPRRYIKRAYAAMDSWNKLQELVGQGDQEAEAAARPIMEKYDTDGGRAEDLDRVIRAGELPERLAALLQVDQRSTSSSDRMPACSGDTSEDVEPAPEEPHGRKRPGDDVEILCDCAMPQKRT